MLLKKDCPVRAFVNHPNQLKAEFKGFGAEIFVGNLFDFSDLTQAMAGVFRALHCQLIAPHLLHSSMLTREHWIASNFARWIPDVGANLGPKSQNWLSGAWGLLIDRFEEHNLTASPIGLQTEIPALQFQTNTCCAGVR